MHIGSFRSFWPAAVLGVAAASVLGACDVAQEASRTPSARQQGDLDQSRLAADDPAKADVKLERQLTKIAITEVELNRVTWTPQQDFDSLTLKIRRPDGSIVTSVFSPGETPWADASAGDGLYKYELVAAPTMSGQTRRALQAYRDSADDPVEQAEVGNSFVMPEPTIPLSGTFRVLDGKLVDPLLQESKEQQR